MHGSRSIFSSHCTKQEVKQEIGARKTHEFSDTSYKGIFVKENEVVYQKHERRKTTLSTLPPARDSRPLEMETEMYNLFLLLHLMPKKRI